MSIQKKRELRNLQPKKKCKKLVLTTTELKVTSVHRRKRTSKYKMIDSITNVFDTLQTNRLDNQIWKWFVIFALLFLVTEMAIIRFMK
jgi:hypothetical protein